MDSSRCRLSMPKKRPCVLSKSNCLSNSIGPEMYAKHANGLRRTKVEYANQPVGSSYHNVCSWVEDKQKTKHDRQERIKRKSRFC